MWPFILLSISDSQQYLYKVLKVFTAKKLIIFFYPYPIYNGTFTRLKGCCEPVMTIFKGRVTRNFTIKTFNLKFNSFYLLNGSLFNLIFCLVHVSEHALSVYILETSTACCAFEAGKRSRCYHVHSRNGGN